MNNFNKNIINENIITKNLNIINHSKLNSNKTLHKTYLNTIYLLLEKKLKEENIQAVILSGSVAINEETEHSDIDISFFVNKTDLPIVTRSFYEFNKKFIEEQYFDINLIKKQKITNKEIILFDKSGKLKQTTYNIYEAKKEFLIKLKNAIKYQKLAEKYFNQKDYEKSFYYLYSMDSPSYILMHSLPPLFDFSYPSFKLFKSIKEIDKLNNTDFFNQFRKFFSFKNNNSNNVLEIFKKAYLIMNKIKRNENNNLSNLGFYDKIKIDYNVFRLKRTFKEYPFLFAHRFILSCIVMWAFDPNNNKKYKQGQNTNFDIKNKIILKESFYKITGLKKLDKNLVEKKLLISEKILKKAILLQSKIKK